MLYEKLEAPMRETVDAWIDRLAPLGWQRRSDLLIEAALPFGEQFPDEQARQATRGFITAVLERLPGGATVTDPHQACLYQLSLDAHHRYQAERYLDSHPELAAMIERELGDDDEDPGATDA